MQAALQGAREVGFTVLSMSISLVAVFIPILLMGGIVGPLVPRVRGHAVGRDPGLAGRLAHHDADDVRAAACARRASASRAGSIGASERGVRVVLRGYDAACAWALRHRLDQLLVLLATVALNVYLYVIIPKGFFPQQDTGRLIGAHPGRPEHLVPGDAPEARRLHGDRPGRSGRGERRRLHRRRRSANTGCDVRRVEAAGASARSRPTRSSRACAASSPQSPGANLFLQPVQDIRIGGRQSNAQYQYTLQADDLAELRAWEPRIRAGAVARCRELADVNTDQQDKGLQTSLVDRSRRRVAARRHAAADRHHAERRVRPARRCRRSTRRSTSTTS